MDINLAFENVINYFEENMCKSIDYEIAAQIMGTSVFHFQRMFSYLTEIPVAEYIRRRKMTLAAFDLKNSNERIIDIALKYGYESHSSFSRAFQLFHGVTPITVRDKGASIQVYSPVHLEITIRGMDAINFRIERTEAFQLFGKEDIILPMKQKFALEFILKYGDRVVENGTHDSINVAAGFPVDDNHSFHLLHGIYFKDKEEQTHFMYGWELPKSGVEDSFTVIDVPKTTWAVFNYHGEHMEGLPKIWTFIYTNWLLTSGYKTDDTIIIEKEAWLDEEQRNFHAEVWLPIKDLDSRNEKTL